MEHHFAKNFFVIIRPIMKFATTLVVLRWSYSEQLLGISFCELSNFYSKNITITSFYQIWGACHESLLMRAVEFFREFFSESGFTKVHALLIRSSTMRPIWYSFLKVPRRFHFYTHIFRTTFMTVILRKRFILGFHIIKSWFFGMLSVYLF